MTWISAWIIGKIIKVLEQACKITKGTIHQDCHCEPVAMRINRFLITPKTGVAISNRL